MPNSKEYNSLQRRIRELRNHFLPAQFSATGIYTKMKYDRARAFQLLAHAEIESYLETVVINTANTAYDNWVKNRLITQPLVSMLAYSEGIMPKNLTRDLQIYKSVSGNPGIT